MDDWTLPADRSAAAAARWHVAEALADWPSSDDAVLVASELVTNAVDHGRPPVRLRVVRTDAAAVIEVTDAGHGTPEPRSAGAHEARGRGLSLVASLARDWGWEDTADGVRVWALLPRP